MEQEIITFSTKYAELLTLEDYEALNKTISDAKNYPRDSTEQYAPLEPKPVTEKYYMEIGAHLQEAWPETLIGITLVDRVPDEIIIP